MKYLLDTNVISEPMKARPNHGVVAWLSGLDEAGLYQRGYRRRARYGIERLATGKRREILEAWLRKDLSGRFEGRILPVDL